MKTTLDSMSKTCLTTKLEIVRFKAKTPYLSGTVGADFDSFLQEISNTLGDLHDHIVRLKKEIEE